MDWDQWQRYRRKILLSQWRNSATHWLVPRYGKQNHTKILPYILSSSCILFWYISSNPPFEDLQGGLTCKRAYGSVLVLCLLRWKPRTEFWSKICSAFCIRQKSKEGLILRFSIISFQASQWKTWNPSANSPLEAGAITVWNWGMNSMITGTESFDWMDMYGQIMIVTVNDTSYVKQEVLVALILTKILT